ncbi:RNA polymerase sigma factor [Maribacter sp. 2307ULW6-5]|uniref:RNA polymerase sigma factor n=1 Tax=Maribacter sp. 2307ULW6-5 TaxID=3386275 RepID=UPI0039BC43D9
MKTEKINTSISASENGLFVATNEKSSNFDPVKDEALWQQFKAGDEAAFGLIYKRNAEKLFRYGMKIVRNKELVKDAVQSLFVDLWNNKEKLSAIKTIQAYLFKSLRRSLIRKAAKERKLINICQDNTLFSNHTPSAEFNLIEKQRFDEKRRALQSALGHLNLKQREILHLKFYARLNYEEIMQVMNLNKKAAYNLLARSLKKLQAYMSILVFTLLYLSSL